MEKEVDALITINRIENEYVLQKTRYKNDIYQWE